MNISSPIQLITSPDFTKRSGANQLFSNDTPNSLRVSANGRHIALNNDERIHLFDLQHPEESWQEKEQTKLFDNSIVVPTDSGGYWLYTDANTLRLINHNGACVFRFKEIEIGNLWGTDEWILTHHNHQLQYIRMDNFCRTSARHKQIILHAWKHKNCIRLLSMTTKNTRLNLHEWDQSENSPKLITSTRYNHDFYCSGLHACYMITKHIHAWPLNEGAILIKLMPWAITISSDGNIHISDDPIAWHPIRVSSKGLPKQKLSELTVAALDGNFDSRAGLGSTPFLITTLEQSGEVHFISTLWHKKISKNKIDKITDEVLNDSLENYDIVILLLANAKVSLPCSEHLADSYLKLLEQKENHIFLQKKTDLIAKSSEKLFLIYLKEFVETNSVNKHQATQEMCMLLKTFSQHPILMSAFFSAFNDKRLDYHDKGIITSKMKMVVPFISIKKHSLIPENILMHTQKPLHTITQADEETVLLLLDVMPTHLFTFNIVLFVLTKFPSNFDILQIVFTKPKAFWKKYQFLSGSKRLDLNAAILGLNADYRNQAILLLPCYNISFFEDLDDPYIHFVKSIRNHEVSTSKIADFIAFQSINNTPLIYNFIIPALTIIKESKMIPSFIYTMAELCNAKDLSDLLSIEILEGIPQSQLNNNHAIIESIWGKAEVIDTLCQWAYAVVLLQALNRCLGIDSSSVLSTDRSSIRNTFITEEAKLLQETVVIKKSEPIQEILSCLRSEAGMSESRKRISSVVLQNNKGKQP